MFSEPYTVNERYKQNIIKIILTGGCSINTHGGLSPTEFWHFFSSKIDRIKTKKITNC